VNRRILTSTPGLWDMWSMIQSIATEKSAGARIQPCLTPDVVWNRPDKILATTYLGPCVLVQCHYEVQEDVWDSLALHSLPQCSPVDQIEGCFDVKVCYMQRAVKFSMKLRQQTQSKDGINCGPARVQEKYTFYWCICFKKFLSPIYRAAEHTGTESPYN